MKIQLLPSTIDGEGRATPEQRLSCFLIDDRVTIDAGSIAIAKIGGERVRFNSNAGFVPLLMSRRTSEPGGQARPLHEANRGFT